MWYAWIAAALAAPLPAGTVLIELSGMDCAGCVPEVEGVLTKVNGVSAARVSYVGGRACVRLSKPVEDTALHAAIEKAGFSTTSVTPVDDCPRDVLPGAPRSLWTEAKDLDVLILSRDGSDVDVTTTFASGKYTIVDFGAPWCGPCVKGAATLIEHMESHPEVAVRAIELPGANAAESFATPVAQHYLAFAPGLPWMFVYAPDGREVYKGDNVQKAIAATSP